MNSNSQDQEIDLGQVFSKIGALFQKGIDSIFDLIFFIKKKIIIISILFIIGVGLAFLSDKKAYDHEVSVIPNFGSNEYLYKKIEQIDTKLREKDAVFFKELGIKNYEDVKSVEIEAYPAIYSFVNNKGQENNFELIKLMAEDGDIDKIMKDDITSKNYYHHKVCIQTKGMLEKKEFITPLLNYLNSNTYYQKQQEIHQKNLSEKIISNDSLISQIDKLIFLLSSNNSSGTISISEKNSIPQLVEKKDGLITQNQYLFTNKIISDKIIKEESSIINIRNYKPLFLNNKILFPVLLILIYLVMNSLIKVYKKQLVRINK